MTVQPAILTFWVDFFPAFMVLVVMAVIAGSRAYTRLRQKRYLDALPWAVGPALLFAVAYLKLSW